MGEFAPLKTGQLVIRFHAPWRKRVLSGLSVLLVLLSIYGAFEFGRYRSGYNVLAASQEHNAFTARILELQNQTALMHDRLTQAEVARSVDRRSFSDVEKTLADLNAQLQHEREQVAFYRGIVSPSDGIGGLKIQGLDIGQGSEERHYKLRLVLMQALRQDASISGSVKVELEGTRAHEAVKLSLAEAGGSSKGDGDLPFSFRYFQNLEQDIVLPPDFEPSTVHVEVKSSKSGPVQQTFPWQVQSAE